MPDDDETGRPAPPPQAPAATGEVADEDVLGWLFIKTISAVDGLARACSPPRTTPAAVVARARRSEGVVAALPAR